MGCTLLTAIPAVILGQSAKKEIDASDGVVVGRGNAQAGFVLGIVGIVLPVLLVVAVFVFGGLIKDLYESTCPDPGSGGAAAAGC